MSHLIVMLPLVVEVVHLTSKKMKNKMNMTTPEMVQKLVMPQRRSQKLGVVHHFLPIPMQES